MSAKGPEGPGFDPSKTTTLEAPRGGARSPEGHAPGISKGSNLRTNGSGGDQPPGYGSERL